MSRCTRNPAAASLASGRAAPLLDRVQLDLSVLVAAPQMHAAPHPPPVHPVQDLPLRLEEVPRKLPPEPQQPYPAPHSAPTMSDISVCSARSRSAIQVWSGACEASATSMHETLGIECRIPQVDTARGVARRHPEALLVRERV
eukprot:2922443-Rhodomonas_salina.2